MTVLRRRRLNAYGETVSRLNLWKQSPTFSTIRMNVTLVVSCLYLCLSGLYVHSFTRPLHHRLAQFTHRSGVERIIFGSRGLSSYVRRKVSNNQEGLLQSFGFCLNGRIRRGHDNNVVQTFSLFSSPSSNQFETAPRGTVQLANPIKDGDENEDHSGFVRAPLKFVGPYPCLALEFPKLQTPKQRKEQGNKSGVALDFVLDTAANTNTIVEGVAQQLKLPILGKAPGGVGAGGAISSGIQYLLGDCQIDLPKSFPRELKYYYRPPIPLLGTTNDTEETSSSTINGHQSDATNGETISTLSDNATSNINGDNHIEAPPFLFMTNLSASSLPLAAPGTAGLLSNTFLNIFDQGGVEFEWHPKTLSFPPTSNVTAVDYSSAMSPSPFKTTVDDEDLNGNTSDSESINTVTVPPSVTFHSSPKSILDQDSLDAVSIEILSKTNLPTIYISFNGSPPIRALLDTGSPITVLNEEAAQLANLETFQLVDEEDARKNEQKSARGWMNPLSNLFQSSSSQSAKAKAIQRGDVLLVGSSNGQPTELWKTNDPIRITAMSSSLTDVAVNGGDTSTSLISLTQKPTSVYVGELPGMKVLEELNNSLNGVGSNKNKMEQINGGGGGGEVNSSTTSSAASPPAVILGMDVLRQMKRMIYTPTKVYFDTRQPN